VSLFSRGVEIIGFSGVSGVGGGGQGDAARQPMQDLLPIYRTPGHPNVLPSPRSLCDWPRKCLHLLEEGQNHPIVRFACLCHMIREELVCWKFSSFLYIKLIELALEVAFYNRSAVTHYKVKLLKFPLCSGSSDRTDDAFVLLICFCFFHL